MHATSTPSTIGRADAQLAAAAGAKMLVMIALCSLECMGSLSSAATAAEDAESVADKVNPCKLITQAEVQSALGMPVGPGVPAAVAFYRICAFKPVSGNGTYYVNVSLLSTDKAAFDKVDPRQKERATGTNLDAFFLLSSPVLAVWHAGNQMEIQVSFGDNAGTDRVKTAELKLAAIAVTRY